MSAARRAPKESRHMRLPRAEAVIAGTGVLSLAGVAALAVLYIGQHQDLQTANGARDALARQVQSLGGTPVAGSPGSRGDVGPIGATGPRGPRGYSGEPAPTITPSPGPSGASGKPGADSTVPGPSGSPGSPGENATGVPGSVGPSGAAGSDGRDGSPPAGWTWSWTDSTGVTHTYNCEPVDNFDKSDPKYRCTETGTSTPEPTDSPSPQSHGLLGLALVADRRRWF